MDRKRYMKCQGIIGGAIGAAAGVSIATGNVMLLLVAVFAGLIAEQVCRRRLTEVVEDERIYRLSEIASRRTFQVFTLTAAVAGGVLIALKDIYPQFVQAGYTFAFSVCAMLIMYLVFFNYYNRKGV